MSRSFSTMPSLRLTVCPCCRRPMDFRRSREAPLPLSRRTNGPERLWKSTITSAPQWRCKRRRDACIAPRRPGEADPWRRRNRSHWILLDDTFPRRSSKLPPGARRQVVVGVTWNARGHPGLGRVRWRSGARRDASTGGQAFLSGRDSTFIHIHYQDLASSRKPVGE